MTAKEMLGKVDHTQLKAFAKDPDPWHPPFLGVFSTIAEQCG